MQKKNLVILDFDGTIVDTAPGIVSAVNKLLALHKLNVLDHETVVPHIGMGLKKLIMDVFGQQLCLNPELEKKLEQQFLDIYEKECLHQIKVFSGVLEFIKKSPHSIAIVSNKTEKFIHKILTHLNLDQKPWTAIVGGNTYPQMKPNPMPFEEVMKKVGVSAKNTLVVGDGIPDVQGALNIGAMCAVVSYGYLPAQELLSHGAHFQISSLLEIFDIWQ